MVEVLRTPDDRFDGLPGWPYAPRYVEVDIDGLGLRLAAADEGPEGAPPVVLLHGEPAWGYLWRKVMPPLLAAGLRTVVPDLPGFGRSDKPADREWYSFDRLYQGLGRHLDALGLDDPVTLVVHDWGGILGLPWAIAHPDRVARLVILNTGLYVLGRTPSKAWFAFHDFVERADSLPIGFLIDGGAATDLSDEVRAAYEAPFHEPAAQAGALALPLLVPLSDDAPGAQHSWAANQALTQWRRPTLILWGADDAVLPARIGEHWRDRIPGCLGMETFTPAAHFLQEDQGEGVGERIAAFVASS